MVLVKRDYGKIFWETEGVLYRGHFQHKFEEKVLKSLLRGNPTYWGCEDNSSSAFVSNGIRVVGAQSDPAENITFFDPCLFPALGYAIQHTQSQHCPYTKGIKSEYPTQHPIVFMINAAPYKDKMYKSPGGEGVAIKGPVSLDDITILYSTHVDRLEEFSPYKGNPDNHQALLAQRNRLESKVRANCWTKHDLIDECDTNPEKAFHLVCKIIFGDKLHYTSEEIQQAHQGIAILRKKLR